MEKKPNKLQDIKETASSAAEIMRQIGTPGVLESLKNVKETTAKVSEIIQGLQTPEMVKNIENLLLISENMNSASTKIQNTMGQLNETGIISRTTDLINSAKTQIDSFGSQEGISGQDIRNMSVATREMFISIKELMSELTITVAATKNSKTLLNVQDTIKQASSIYKNMLT
jgi:hypothetical protein